MFPVLFTIGGLTVTSFGVLMAHYDVVPAMIQDKIVSAARAEKGELVEVED